MLKIRENPENRHVYVFDDAAQPDGAHYQYWWDVHDHEMNLFTFDAQFVSRLVLLRDVNQLEIARQVYSTWAELNLSSYVSGEAAYWERINNLPAPLPDSNRYYSDTGECSYELDIDPADMPCTWDGYGDTGEDHGVDYD